MKLYLNNVEIQKIKQEFKQKAHSYIVLRNNVIDRTLQRDKRKANQTFIIMPPSYNLSTFRSVKI